MAFNFPDGASNGDTHTASNGVVYRYNGNQWVIDSAGNNASLDARFLNTTGDGVISGSSQLPSGIVSGSSQVTSILPGGTISGSSQITNVITQNYVSQSAAAAGFGSGVGSSRSDARISGSFLGEVSSSNYLQNVKDTISGSFSLSRLPAGTISGSGQLPSGIVSGSGQLPSGIVSGSSQLPSGTISGSEQIHDLNFVSSSTTDTIQVMTSASYATITPVNGTLYIIQG